MNIDRTGWIFLAVLPLLAGCAHDQLGLGEPNSTFGEANRQTMMAQVVNPDPEYEFLDPDTSGEHAAQAIERYRSDRVKRPERIRSTETVGGRGNGSQ